MELNERLVRFRHCNDVALADLKEKSLRIVERAAENHENEIKRQIKESAQLDEDIAFLRVTLEKRKIDINSNMSHSVSEKDVTVKTMQQKIDLLKMELAKEDASLAALNASNIEQVTKSGEELLEHQCRACMVSTIDTFFKPCGHTLYCSGCME